MPKATLAVTGVLKSVTPKHAEGTTYNYQTQQNESKGNTLDLLISVKVPSPKPPLSYPAWVRAGDGLPWNVNEAIKDAERELTKLEREDAVAEKPAKPPAKGAHWFSPLAEVTDESPANMVVGQCAGHPKCGRTEPDGAKCWAVPDLEALRDRARLALTDATAARDGLRQEKYTKYHAACIEQTQTAMLAAMGSGMFFALLGQEVKVDFRPSDRIFQPMLEIAQTMPGQVALPTMEMLNPGGLVATAEDEDDEDDEDDFDDGDDE